MTMEELVSHPFLIDDSSAPRKRSFSMPPRTKPIEIESVSETGSYICNPLETESPVAFAPPSFSPSSFSCEPRQMAHTPMQSSTSLKVRNLYERFYGIEEVYQITFCSSDIREIVYLYFLILHMLNDLVDIIKVKLNEKKLKPSRKLAKIIMKSIQRYNQVYLAFSSVRKDIHSEDKTPSFHKIVFRHVITLEGHSNDPKVDLTTSYRCLNSAILLLLLLRMWWDEESINKENINHEIGRFLKKKKMLKTRGSFSSSSSFLFAK